ncbi:hypothetical protein ACIQU6_03420, partial [Streptomyces sp. NPDC090442]|uniref:hypothetical protein n=1 Tax=Streptomyces sp. NPDC090442 TaxID=3365962 RepID=UPI0038233714
RPRARPRDGLLNHPPAELPGQHAPTSIAGQPVSARKEVVAISGEQRDQDPLGVHIGAREIYDEVVGLREDVRTMGQQGEAVRQELADHETRIRDLERWKYALPIAAVSGVVAAGVTVATATGKG